MMLTRTRSEGTMFGLIIALIIVLIVTWLYIKFDKAYRSQPPQGETIQGPNQRPVITLPDNVVQNRIDISQLSIDDAGILTIEMNLTLDDGFYYVTAKLPVKGTRLKFKDYNNRYPITPLTKTDSTSEEVR